MGGIAADVDGAVAVLLVHGIGRQRAGEATTKFIRGLRRAYRAELSTTKTEHASLVQLPGRTVRVYEAYWADLLAVDAVAGSFSPLLVHELAWFPWLNLKTGMYQPRPRIRVLLWTVVLAPAAIGIQLLWITAHAVAGLFGRGGVLTEMLDQVVADVLNYVDSAAGATSEGSPLRDAADNVHQRFDAALVHAHTDGCSEVHVVAHSLGTLIAAQRLFATEVPAHVELVTGLYTIGSPLRRIRFLWPRLFESSSGPERLRWLNFWDPLDVVSNRIPARGWPACHNVWLAGGAGLARAHVRYEAQPRFTRRLVGELGAELPPRRVRPHLRMLLAFASLAESALVILVLAGALLIGLLLCVAFATIFAVIGSLKSAAQSGVTDDRSITASVLVMFAIVVVGYFILWPLGYGRYKAGYAHYRHRFGCEARLHVDGEANQAPISAWMRHPRRRWNQDLSAAVIYALLVAGIIAVCAVGLLGGLAGGVDLPWADGLGIGTRVLAAIVDLVVGILFSLGLVLGASLALELADHAILAARDYHEWRQATTTPPENQSAADERSATEPDTAH